MAVVVAEDLRKVYQAGRRGEVRALDGLSFSVEEGTVYALLGPNGAGKSTTVKILTTLTRPSGGSAWVAGVDVLARPRQVRSVIGAVSQRGGAVSLLTGRENLALQAGVYGLGGWRLKARVGELLAEFDLTEAADRQVRTYSGGMRRRLDIATVLVHRPSVLFLDEPTTGLDPEGRADLWTALTGLAAGGTTILVTTHYLEEADQYAARIAIVDRGAIVAEGTADELKSSLPVDYMPVRSVTVARPSLDDVYLHHAGRSFGQAERIETR